MANSELRKLVPLSFRKVLKKSAHSVCRVLMYCSVVSFAVYAYFFSEWFTLSAHLEENKWSILIFWILIVILSVFSQMIYHILYFLTYYYEMDEKNLVIRKGVIVRREITLPFNKITDVYVDQDVMDVLFGIYDVYLSTPTAESLKYAHIDGVTRKGSQKLRELVLDAINRESSKSKSSD